jgi:hypothetical protein
VEPCLREFYADGVGATNTSISVAQEGATQATARVGFWTTGASNSTYNELSVALRRYDTGWAVESWKPVTVMSGELVQGGRSQF